MAFPLPSPSSDLTLPISQPCPIGGQSSEGLLHYTITKKAGQNQNNSHVKKLGRNLVTKWLFFFKMIRTCAINNFNGNAETHKGLNNP